MNDANREPEEHRSETPLESGTALPEPCAATVRTLQQGAAETGSALDKEELDRLARDIVAALKTVYDPEIPVDIYELGLIYKVDIADNRDVTVDMTLTAPGCPVAGDMPVWVENAVASVDGVGLVTVNMVFDPPWDMSRMTEDARFALNLY
jgi:FeS assembly SUF system protein